MEFTIKGLDFETVLKLFDNLVNVLNDNNSQLAKISETLHLLKEIEKERLLNEKK